MEFIKFNTDSPLYNEEIKLREKALREPLGLKFTKEFLEPDKSAYHYCLLDTNGKMVACLLINEINENKVKLRQMAVKEDLRGKGVGRELVEKVEAELSSGKFNKIELHARKYAEGFYEKLGYLPVGQEFTEIGIPHIKMIKQI